MELATCQTAEDGWPRVQAHTVLSREGRGDEAIRVEMPVRLPWSLAPRVRVVVRAYQATGDVTIALESVRVE